jgi:hypothetical protein
MHENEGQTHENPIKQIKSANPQTVTLNENSLRMFHALIML